MTKAQKGQLLKDGYIKFNKIVPQKMVNVALRAINHSISKGIDPAKVPTFRSTSYCPELKHHSSIKDLLLKTPLWEAAESLMGAGNVQMNGGGQIALRFPIMERPGALHPHIDGTYTPTNRVPKGTIGSFTALAGVFLSDIPNRFWGNFTAWPGSHRLLEKYFQQHGTESLQRGLPPVKLPEPVQIIAEAGDAILCHYLTVHTVVANVSPYIRYAVFFRLAHVNHRAHRNIIFTDIWREWPGIV